MRSVAFRAQLVAVTVYQYERDAEGHHFRDPETMDVAKREPFTVPLRHLPDVLDVLRAEYARHMWEEDFYRRRHEVQNRADWAAAGVANGG